MHRVLVDTNVLIDLVSGSRPQHGAATRAVAALLRAPDYEGFVLASSLKDVYYVYRRHYGDEVGAREAVRALREMFTPLSLDARNVDVALDSDEPDFEDGIVRAVGEAALCDLLLTRDARGFVRSSMRKIEAPDLLELISSSDEE